MFNHQSSRDIWFDIYKFDQRELLQGNIVEINCHDTYFKQLKFSLAAEMKQESNIDTSCNIDSVNPRINIDLFGSLILTRYNYNPNRRLPLELMMRCEIVAIKALTCYITYRSQKIDKSTDNYSKSMVNMRKRVTTVQICEYIGSNNNNKSDKVSDFKVLSTFNVESTMRRISDCIRIFIDKKSGDTKVVLNNKYNNYKTVDIKVEQTTRVNWGNVCVVLKDCNGDINGVEVYDALNRKSYQFQQEIHNHYLASTNVDDKDKETKVVDQPEKKQQLITTSPQPTNSSQSTAGETASELKAHFGQHWTQTKANARRNKRLKEKQRYRYHKKPTTTNMLLNQRNNEVDSENEGAN